MKKVQFKTKETINSDEKVRMTITQNKQVGIGTENPSQTIDVSGGLSVNGSIKKNGSDLYNLSSKELKDLSGVDYQTPNEEQIFSWKDASNVWGAQTIEKTWSTKQDEMGTILTYNVADSNVAIGKNMASNWETWEYNQEISDPSGNPFKTNESLSWGLQRSFVTYENTILQRVGDESNKFSIYEISGGIIELKQTIVYNSQLLGGCAMYGDYIAIGDSLNDKVRIYKKTNGVWNTTPHQTFTESQNGYFGQHLAISDKWLVILGWQFQSYGTVYIYKKNNSDQFVSHGSSHSLYNYDEDIINSYGGKVQPAFINIEGDKLYISAVGNNNYGQQGIYMYDLTDTGWTRLPSIATTNFSTTISPQAFINVLNENIYFIDANKDIIILKPDNNTSPPSFPVDLQETINVLNTLINTNARTTSIIDRFIIVDNYDNSDRKVFVLELINATWVLVKEIIIYDAVGEFSTNIVKEQDDYYLVIVNEKTSSSDDTGKLILYKLTKHHYIQDVSGNSNISNELHIGEKLGVGNNIVPEYPLHVDGTTFSSTSWSTSDDRVKHNEQSIDGAIDTIDKLEPKHYIKTQKMYDASHNFTLNSSGNPVKDNGELLTDYTRETGLIAQEVKDIPELAFAVKDGAPMGVDYNSIHCTHIAATKELNTKIEALKAKNTALEEENTQMEQDLQNIKQHLGI